jgi:hypothetical protein
VNAICKIGNSTKSEGDNSTRYVGEKGIGFKSVFKVADVVHISSKYYSFKFDKYARLGMIAPIWNDFPGDVRLGYTSFYLQLSRKCDQNELVAELKSLDSRMLIFLRKLRQINITIESHPSITRTLSRPPDSVGPAGTTITLRQDTSVMRYIVIEHTVYNLPPEEKRQGTNSSELLLAFPISGSEPALEAQQVYAFLPIRDYGFQVILLALSIAFFDTFPVSYSSGFSFDCEQGRCR